MNSLDLLVHGLLTQAFALYQSARLNDAAARCDAALKIAPACGEAWNLRGLIAGDAGRDEVALASFSEAIRINPAFAHALINQGAVLRRLQRFAEAVACYDRAIACEPGMALAHFNRGNALRDAGHLPEAFDAFRRAAELDPTDPDAFNNCGSILWKTGKYPESIGYFDKALRLAPQHVDACVNKASALERLGDIDQALALYDDLLARDPDLVVAIVNKGALLECRGDFQGALACFRRALAIDPDDPNANWNEALCLLKQGDYRQGWQKYEWRWKGPRKERVRRFAQPAWQGEELAGRTLLVYAEQGFGDTLQFCRYVPLLRQFGGKVVFEVQPELVSLVQAQPGMEPVFPLGASGADFDVQCPLLSLPFLFGTQVETIPATVPYLQVPPATAAKWQGRMACSRRKRVGVVWRTTTEDRTRSMPVEQMAALFAARDIDFVVLQKELSDAEKSWLAAWENVHGCDADLVDFADTAALIGQLDSVISIDTAVAHLAGALGKELMILLPWVGEWRWLEDRVDSPWYPSARLFRQASAGDWGGVLGQVVQAL